MNAAQRKFTDLKKAHTFHNPPTTFDVVFAGVLSGVIAKGGELEQVPTITSQALDLLVGVRYASELASEAQRE